MGSDNDVTITVSNTASITVPADAFGEGRKIGPNAVDAFTAAAAAVGGNPTSVGVVGGTGINNKYAEAHLAQAAASKTASKTASKSTDADELEKLHLHMHDSVKATGIDVRKAAKQAIGAAVLSKGQEHEKEEEVAKVEREEGAGLVMGERPSPLAISIAGEALMEAHGSQPATEKKSSTATDTEKPKDTWAQVINKRAEEERRREVLMASMSNDGGQLLPAETAMAA